jgi:hypothetical protein
MPPASAIFPDDKRDAVDYHVRGNGTVRFNIKPLAHVPTSYPQLCQQNVWITRSPIHVGDSAPEINLTAPSTNQYQH